MEVGDVLAIVFGVCLLISLVVIMVLYLSRHKIVKFVDHSKEGVLKSFDNLDTSDKKYVIKGMVNSVSKEDIDTEEMMNLLGRGDKELDDNTYEKESLPLPRRR